MNDYIKEAAENLVKAKKVLNNEWYSSRSLFGNDNMLFYLILGARMAGKSYDILKFFIRQFVKKKRVFYWLRLKEDQTKKLLQNNAEKLVDPDLRRLFKLDLVTNGPNVYNVTLRDAKGKIKKKELMCRVLPLSTFYNDKGNGYYDKDFLANDNMYYNIALDEFQRERSEKSTFDICYALVNQLENLIRTTKNRLRIVFIGNTLEDASDILSMFNFIPEKFGRYKLKSKRCIIDYIEPSQKYLDRRKGSVADILAPDESTFTNDIKIDKSLVYKGRLSKPKTLIKFYKKRDSWFCVWDDGVIAPYNGETINRIIAMRPYLDERFDPEMQSRMIELFDNRSFLYKDLITFKKFQKEIFVLKPRK